MGMCEGSPIPMYFLIGTFGLAVNDEVSGIPYPQEMDKTLSLEWKPREQNQEADALTNSDFSLFDPSLRVEEGCVGDGQGFKAQAVGTLAFGGARVPGRAGCPGCDPGGSARRGSLCGMA
eukprot:4917170-Amphidinium_carterae.1